MLGAVVGTELLRAARRGRAHVLVWLFAGWLVLQFLYLYAEYAAPVQATRTGFRPSTFADTAAFARSFVDLVLGQQFVLLALVAPAFAAGSITDEKTRGTLQYLLTTRLTPASIVLGKLCARTVQVGVLGLVPLPLVALVGPYAGITPEFLLIWLIVGALLVAGVSAVGVLASVWVRQTRNAVLLAYALLVGLWFLRGLVEQMPYLPHEWLDAFDPLRPLAPALDRSDPAEAFRLLGGFVVAWGGLALVCAVLAVWQLRPAYLRQLDARPRSFRLSLATAPAADESNTPRASSPRPSGRPAPGDDALAWKESYVGRRLSPRLGLVLAAVATACATAAAIGDPPTPFVTGGMMSIGWWAFVVLTIAVGVRASGTITGERERQTWEGLLTTPLSEQEIVRGKLRGILRSAWWYLITFGLAAILTAMFLAPVAALGVVLVIGPAMVVIAAAMYFVGAAGLYCSARSQSSWRSLLATLAMGYAGAFLLFCCSGVVFYVGALILAAILSQSGSLGWLIITPVGWLAAVALAYWWAGAMLLATAEMRIALSDRIPNGRGRLIDLDLPYHPTRRVRRPPL